ncbi:MAG: hypothetical protein J6Y04_10780 [Bacteroidaceae bacterium]|nr:hypothetical protein [Bacteroidaceae bacterium]
MSTNQNEKESRRVVCAREVSLFVILRDFVKGLFEKKCAVVLTAILSFLGLVYLHYADVQLEGLVSNLSDFNLNMLGIDIAIVSILIGLFSSNKLEGKANTAYNSQYAIISFNALLQLLGVLLSILVESRTGCTLLYATLFVQFWAIFGVFDLFIEIYTFHSLSNS